MAEIKCRGRNGWFILDGWSVSTNSSNKEIRISFHSKQIGKHDPIEIVGNEQDIIDLFKKIGYEICTSFINKIKSTGGN